MYYPSYSNVNFKQINEIKIQYSLQTTDILQSTFGSKLLFFSLDESRKFLTVKKAISGKNKIIINAIPTQIFLQ